MGSDWKNAAKTFFKKDSLDDVVGATMPKGKLTREQAEALYNMKKAYKGKTEATETLTNNKFKLSSVTDMIKKKTASQAIGALSGLSDKDLSTSDQEFITSEKTNNKRLNEYQ